MTFSGHLAAASFVLTATGNPYSAVPLCFVSHLAIDAVPHAEWRPWKRASLTAKAVMIADALVTLSIVWLMYARLPVNSWVVSAGLVASLLPDLTARLAPRYAPAFHFIHERMHTWPLRPVDPIDWNRTVTGRVATWIKVALQAGIVAAALVILLSNPATI